MNFSKNQILKIIKCKFNFQPIPGLNLSLLFSSTSSPEISINDTNNLFEFSAECSEADKNMVIENLSITNDFVSISEEQSLLSEIEPYMKRLRYEYDHWDNAIHGFRETEKLKWNDSNTKIITRLQEFVFGEIKPLPYIHILDLAENGHIKPHIDSVRFCGNTIAGVSLLSDSVMRFVKENIFSFSVLLKRRSLYVMRGPVRYDFTHEILPNEKSFIHGVKVNKKRRISVISRNQPDEKDEDTVE